MFKIIATYFLLQTSVENCNVSALDNMFRTPLHWAAVLGRYDTVQSLYTIIFGLCRNHVIRENCYKGTILQSISGSTVAQW